MKTKRILAVDDDPAALGALRQILLQGGFEVATTTSGEDALAWLGTNTADLILLDVIMPGLSGYDVCARIRADPRTAAIPVIFLTAKGRAADRTQGKEAGSDLYLIKPVLATRLLNMVGVFLKDKGTRPRP
ncbi:MAG TPA: response regulator [Vicinamibacteria bacterium]|nr:response regulator [Vicinamibacteria bacterium]